MDATSSSAPGPAVVPVIALVCSAGGLVALREVLAGLPADLDAAVVVLQHASPDRPSLLPELLAGHTDLRVQAATDGARLEPGLVLVSPSGSHALVTPDRRISLVMSGGFPPSRPSADLMLTTLALAAGRSAIAVVMTGGGHDGATGATAVHKHGGLVVATDEATSVNFSMPGAAIGRDSIVDHVVALPDLAAHLARLVRSARDRGVPRLPADRG